MKRREFHIGPGATSLILVAVVLCMSALGVLGLVNSRNDVRLSERSIAVAESVSMLYDQAERTLASLDALVCAWQAGGLGEEELRVYLPEGVVLEDGAIRWQENNDRGQTLQCAVRMNEANKLPRLIWSEHRIVTETGAYGLEEIGWN